MRPSLLTIMDDFFDDIRPITTGVTRKVYGTPALNVKEMKDRYEVELYIPGLQPKDVKIELHDKVLSVSYDHENESKNKTSEGEYLRQEYAQYSFTRSLTLPKNVDENSITAKSGNGILTIVINKLPETQPKSISIEVE